MNHENIRKCKFHRKNLWETLSRCLNKYKYSYGSFLLTNVVSAQRCTRRIQYNHKIELWFVNPIFNIKLREKRFCELWTYPIPSENFSLCPVKLKKLEVRFASLRRDSYPFRLLSFSTHFHSDLFMPLCHVFSQFLGVDFFPFFR